MIQKGYTYFVLFQEKYNVLQLAKHIVLFQEKGNYLPFNIAFNSALISLALSPLQVVRLPSA
jgi:hypothetical protein